jgi:hypothetical protein
VLNILESTTIRDADSISAIGLCRRTKATDTAFLTHPDMRHQSKMNLMRPRPTHRSAYGLFLSAFVLAACGATDSTPDSDCSCTTVDAPDLVPPGRVDETSLTCLCAAHFCPPSESDGRASVRSGGTVKTYEACGLREIRFRNAPSPNPIRWIFDLTSGSLVGQLWDTDVCIGACGCTIRAGRFPAGDCVVTSEETICSKTQQTCADGGSDAR